MGSDIQLISDGDRLAVIGDPAAVELFLTSEGLTSRDVGLPRLRSVFSIGSGVAQAASEIALVATDRFNCWGAAGCTRRALSRRLRRGSSRMATIVPAMKNAQTLRAQLVDDKIAAE